MLAELGFEVEPFGGRAIIVHSVPNPHPYFDAERCLREMIAELTTGSPLVDSARTQHQRIALTMACKGAIKAGQKLTIILPVGPMGMYKTVVKRLKASKTRCDHVTTFNMDEWSDARGNTMPGDQPGGFEHAMTEALFAPLGRLTVPANQCASGTSRTWPASGPCVADAPTNSVST